MKTDLEVFLEMNQNDIKNGTQHLKLGTDLVQVEMARGGVKVTMGISGTSFREIMSREVIPVLILVDKEEFFRLKHMQPENNQQL